MFRRSGVVFFVALSAALAFSGCSVDGGISGILVCGLFLKEGKAITEGFPMIRVVAQITNATGDSRRIDTGYMTQNENGEQTVLDAAGTECFYHDWGALVRADDIDVQVLLLNGSIGGQFVDGEVVELNDVAVENALNDNDVISGRISTTLGIKAVFDFDKADKVTPISAAIKTEYLLKRQLRGLMPRSARPEAVERECRLASKAAGSPGSDDRFRGREAGDGRSAR